MGKVTWPERLYALDVSRALASLAVVLYHWVHFAFDEGINESYQADYSMSDQPLFSILGLFYQKGSYGVDYFFLLSGFIFYWIWKILDTAILQIVPLAFRHFSDRGSTTT